MDFTNENHITALQLSVSEFLGTPVHIGVPENAQSWDDCEFSGGDNPKPSWSAISVAVEAAVAASDLKELRLERDKLISDTDWWVLPDRTATQAQLDYRQALRDITNTYTSLADVVWPEKP